MAPVYATMILNFRGTSTPPLYRRSGGNHFGDWRNVDEVEAYILEGWGEGFMLGALLIMAVITVANMRKRVLLHKLILLELLFAMSHGTFCFMSFHGYGWYLSATAALLYCSYFTHNVVAWMKIRPFFTGPQASFSPKTCKYVTWIYLTTLAMTAPVIIFEIFNNFRFFNNISKWYEHVRPYEPLMRDPWWVFSCLILFHVIRRCYSLNVFRLIGRSPRFGILLCAICMAIIFTIMDILASIVRGLSITDGINPYWKLALVFKCLTDNIMLDDFKSVLQRLGALKLDGTTTAMHANAMNLTPNEKSGLGERDEMDEDAEASSWPSRRERGHSLSGRVLEDGEALDAFGRGRRKHSMAATAVGKIGTKIRGLPALPSLRSSEREAQRNAEKNKTVSNASSSDAPERHDDRPPWEQVDFITALTDPTVEDSARGK